MNDVEQVIMRDRDGYIERHYAKMNEAQKAYFDGLEKHIELEIIKIEQRIADWIISGCHDV